MATSITTTTTSTTTRVTSESQPNGEEEIDLYSIPILPRNVGHLQQESTEIDCPSCNIRNMTRVEHEGVTCPQRFIDFCNLFACKLFKRRSDINHYCSRCGCYIGRFIKLTKAQKYGMKDIRRLLENNDDELLLTRRAWHEACVRSGDRLRAERN